MRDFFSNKIVKGVSMLIIGILTACLIAFGGVSETEISEVAKVLLALVQTIIALFGGMILATKKDNRS